MRTNAMRAGWQDFSAAKMLNLVCVHRKNDNAKD